MTSGQSDGRMLSLEGIDGAGKSSHLDRLQAYFSQLGWCVLRTREPGGTELAELLREQILHRSMDALTECLLIFAARRDHSQQVIRPALARGDLVLCDRYTDATYAYQGAGRGFDMAVLAQLEAWTQEGLQPDLTLWFDVPPEVAAARLTQARTPDRFEALDSAFFRKVRAGYAARLQAFPERMVRINADQAPELVWGEILQVLGTRAWT